MGTRNWMHFPIKTYICLMYGSTPRYDRRNNKMNPAIDEKEVVREGGGAGEAVGLNEFNRRLFLSVST
ncbi:MAG: hypothetical protein QW767_00925 [Thermoprotei archaeon]